MMHMHLLVTAAALAVVGAVPDVTPLALLPRQSDSPCPGANDAQMQSFDDCLAYVEGANNCFTITDLTDAAGTSAFTTCECNFVADCASCAASFCNTAGFQYYSDFLASSSSACDANGIKPTPFDYTGQSWTSTVSGDFSDGSGAATGAAASNGGQATTPATATASNGGSGGSTSTAAPSSKNAAGSIGAPPALLALGGEGYVLMGVATAWTVGFLGMLFM